MLWLAWWTFNRWISRVETNPPTHKQIDLIDCWTATFAVKKLHWHIFVIKKGYFEDLAAPKFQFLIIKLKLDRCNLKIMRTFFYYCQFTSVLKLSRCRRWSSPTYWVLFLLTSGHSVICDNITFSECPDGRWKVKLAVPALAQLCVQQQLHTNQDLSESVRSRSGRNTGFVHSCNFNFLTYLF